MKPCSECGHPWEEHASDVSHPDTQPCWHGFGYSEPCSGNFDTRCRNYVNPDKL